MAKSDNHRDVLGVVSDVNNYKAYVQEGPSTLIVECTRDVRANLGWFPIVECVLKWFIITIVPAIAAVVTWREEKYNLAGMWWSSSVLST